MIVYAVRLPLSICKECGLNHGYFTFEHQIIIARNQDEKILFPSKYWLRIVAVDTKEFELPTISLEEFYKVTAGRKK